MTDKKIEIFKPNQIIRGNPLNLSLEGKKMMNAIIYAVSKYDFKKRQIKTEMRFFRKAMNLEKDNSYVDIISGALKSLATPIVIKNYKDENGNFYKRKSLAFLDNDFNIGKNTKDANSNKWQLDFKVNQTFFNLIKNAYNGNYTCLEWKKISNKFSSKYSISIYEYLKSFHSDHKYLKVELQTLNETLGTNNLPLSKACIILDRCIKEILLKSDINYLKYEKVKKKKQIIFYFIPKENIEKSRNKKQVQKQIQSLTKKIST